MVREVGGQWVGFLREVGGLVGEGGGDGMLLNGGRGIRDNSRGGVSVKYVETPGLRTRQGDSNLRGLYLGVRELQSRMSGPRILTAPVDNE